MKRFVLGDIHGAYKALIQVIERSEFNLAEDQLIFLGDVVDGFPDVWECVEFLKSFVRNLVFVRGNHDQWFIDSALKDITEQIWLSQGGAATIRSYVKANSLLQEHSEDSIFSWTDFHGQWMSDKSVPFYIDKDNNFFVHAGVTKMKIEDESIQDMMWDRDIVQRCKGGNISTSYKGNPINEIYVGHTSTQYMSDNNFSAEPIHCNNVWFMDTGAGWNGKLSMMNIDTKEVFQSDWVYDLYPDDKGR